jgi:FlaA1/EpsC-like NDP-sugar epimerase
VDILKIIKGALLGTLLFAVYAYVFRIFLGAGFPRSVFVIDLCYNIMLIGGVRVAFRIFSDRFRKDRQGAAGGKKRADSRGRNGREMILRR